MYEQSNEPTPLRTLGRMAEEIGQPIHRVDYVVRTRGIPATAKAGRLRLYGRAAVAAVREEIHRMDRQQGVSRD